MSADELFEKFRVMIVDLPPQIPYSWNSNQATINQQKLDHQKNLEVFVAKYYQLINKIVDLGGLIEPQSYYIEDNKIMIKATDEVANKIKQLPGVSGVVKIK